MKVTLSDNQYKVLNNTSIAILYSEKIEHKDILMITNTRTSEVVYLFNCPDSKSVFTENNQTLTLDIAKDLNSTDELLIIIDDKKAINDNVLLKEILIEIKELNLNFKRFSERSEKFQEIIYKIIH